MAGENTLQIDPTYMGSNEQYSSEDAAPNRSHAKVNPAQGQAATPATVDARRLDTAVRILQSELSLAGNQLSLSENTDLLSQLYEMLGPGGSHVDPLAMVTFNEQLAERIRKDRSPA